jgi:carbamoyl-phosphate synthase large subunit
LTLADYDDHGGIPRSLNILVTGVGAPGTRGTFYALRNNQDGAKVNLIGADLKEDVVGKYWVSSFYSVPPPESEDYIPQMNEICDKESVDVVIPQTTRETAILSSRAKDLHSKVVVSSSSSIERANNKYQLMQVCKKIEIPCPSFYLVKSLDDLIDRAEDLGYPTKAVVVKPPIGFGSRGFRVLRESTSWSTRRFLSEKPDSSEISLDDLSKILSKDKHVDFPELLITEYLPGKEYSVDAFRGAKVKVAIPRLRKQIINGVSFRTSLEYREDLIAYSLRAAEELELKYAFGFQFKLDYQDVPMMLECNPRVQGTMVASFFSGANVIWMAVREALGIPLRESPRVLEQSDFYRYWGGIAIRGGRAVLDI